MQNLPGLVAQLNQPADAETRFVVSQFSPETQTLIRSYSARADAETAPASLLSRIASMTKEEDRLTLSLRIMLTDDLNRLIDNPAMPLAFGAPSPTPLAGEALARYNRRLLTGEFAGLLAAPRRLEATQLNPVNAEIVATSPKAKDMAVNMFSAVWALSITIGTVLLVSLFTKQKTDAELQNLVLGMTPLPEEAPCPWYQKPLFWAAVIIAVLIAVNIIFW
jgi:hypothetical protein